MIANALEEGKEMVSRGENAGGVTPGEDALLRRGMNLWERRGERGAKKRTLNKPSDTNAHEVTRTSQRRSEVTTAMGKR